MPYPLGNRWRLGLNGSAFSWAFLGVVGRSLGTFSSLGSVGEPMGNESDEVACKDRAGWPQMCYS